MDQALSKIGGRDAGQAQAGPELDKSGGGARGLFKSALRGLGFEDQEKMLAPVQAKMGVQKSDKKVAELKKVGPIVRVAALNAVINVCIAKVDDSIATTNNVRLKVVSAEAFELAWQNFCDRQGTPGAGHEASMRGFVDTSAPGGEMGYVIEGSGQGTLIHEALHQKTSAAFEGACGGWMKEGTTELFTRVVLGYMGSGEQRTAYGEAYNALLKLQGRSGLAAVAKWYFKGDRSEVDKAVGASKVDAFVAALAASDVASALAALG